MIQTAEFNELTAEIKFVLSRIIAVVRRISLAMSDAAIANIDPVPIFDEADWHSFSLMEEGDQKNMSKGIPEGWLCSPYCLVVSSLNEN